MQRLEVSGAVRPIYGSLGVKGLTFTLPVVVYGCETRSLILNEEPNLMFDRVLGFRRDKVKGRWNKTGQ